MPRLLSNKEPEKKITEGHKPLIVCCQKKEKRSDLKLHPDPGIREYQIGQLSASEYWKYIMRHGQRKMTKNEWQMWDGKKKREERARYLEWREIKFGY